MLGYLAVQMVQALQWADSAPAETSGQRADAESSPPESDRFEPIAAAKIADAPLVLIVDQMHRGDHTSIGEALAAAHPGDCILVRPGLYEEGLVVDKPLEIVGDGDLCDIVIRSQGKPALSFRTARGRVSNLSLQLLDKGEHSCVDISQGLLELEDCSISSQSLACVAIHGNADPRLRRNRIHESKLSSGVLVYEDGQGTIEDNEIFGNAQAGVEIRGKGRPTLRRNRISRNRYKGIWIYECGGGTFEENDLRDNIQGAWEISEDCRPNLKLSGNLE
jgi:F-box protein 11